MLRILKGRHVVVVVVVVRCSMFEVCVWRGTSSTGIWLWLGFLQRCVQASTYCRMLDAGRLGCCVIAAAMNMYAFEFRRQQQLSHRSFKKSGESIYLGEGRLVGNRTLVLA